METRTLQALLDSLYQNRSAVHLANDPLSFCHRYNDPRDQEISALIASSLAYGNVRVILKNLLGIFDAMGPSPRRFVEEFNPRHGLRIFSGFKHRFNDCRDLCALLLAARTMIDEADSIGEYFLGCHDPGEEDITSSLAKFTASVLALDYSGIFGTSLIPADSRFPFFFPSPLSGSACKRLCMFLRWMVRPADGIDLGIWKTIHPAKLIIPVDAHIMRISGFLGFTSRRQADWKTAREITAALRKFDPQDPVKYDFSLCHLGISEGCNGKDPEACLRCAISEACDGTPG